MFRVITLGYQVHPNYTIVHYVSAVTSIVILYDYYNSFMISVIYAIRTVIYYIVICGVAFIIVVYSVRIVSV